MLVNAEVLFGLDQQAASLDQMCIQQTVESPTETSVQSTTTERLLNELPDANHVDDKHSCSKSRKRKINAKSWTINVKKQKRNSGQEYQTMSGKTIPAKVITYEDNCCAKRLFSVLLLPLNSVDMYCHRFDR